MTSYSQSARENRRRQKRQQQREWRARAAWRKVHRFGFRESVGFRARGVTMSADARRMEQTSLCGANVNSGSGRGSRAVSDDAFIWLPRSFQCEACLATHWPGNWPPRIQRSGVRTHRMALEMLFATMQRLWQARLEVGHRCYVRIGQQSLCACGLASIVDLNLIGVTAARIAGTIDAPNDFARAIVMHHNDRRVQP